VTRRDTTSSSGEWLTLEQASRRLGVHATTLRRWADQGAIGVFLTPGGHRRFMLAELQRFERERHRAQLPALPPQGWADCAISRTRESMSGQRWLVAYGETEREVYRRLGRRLIGLVLQYAARSDDGADLLGEARAIGKEHGRTGLHLGQSLADLLQVISFFRSTLLEVALFQLPEMAPARREGCARLLRRIERLLSEVQSGVVESYAAAQARINPTSGGQI